MVDVFHGSAQIPGASEPWDIELSVDWQMKEVYLRIPQAPSGMTDWSATMVQVIANQELVFRTKGLPGAIAHWWHMFRNRTGGLSGLVLSLPDDEGNWMQCTIIMDRGGLPDTQRASGPDSHAH